MGEATTEGYSLIESPRPRQTLIHVYPDADELGRVFQADQGIVADVNSFALAAAQLQPSVAPSAARRASPIVTTVMSSTR